jgi:anti-sigma factor RsiW
LDVVFRLFVPLMLNDECRTGNFMSSKHNSAEAQHLTQWQDRLQELVDQALTPAETLQVHTHLTRCTMCTREHRRLLTVDARLRNEFSIAATPSPTFDQTLFANIARLEQEQRALARQREQQEHAARLAQLRGYWRGLLRFQLGNLIAAITTAAAVTTAIMSAWPNMASMTATLDKGLLSGAQQVTWLPHGLSIAAPIAAVATAGVIAAAALWITRNLDQRS